MSLNTKRVIRFLIALVLLAVFLNIPLSTKEGVNFKVRTIRIPLYIKVIEFLDRDYRYKILAKEITAGCENDEEKTIALFDWVIKNIHDTPKGFDVIDNHVLDIIIRRYGASDQKADVFTTLCLYAGLPAFWRVENIDDGSRRIVLSYVKLSGKWCVIDVQRKIIIRKDNGELASVEDIISDMSIVKREGEKAGIDSYEKYFIGLEPINKNFISKEEKQKPFYRIMYELQNLFN